MLCVCWTYFSSTFIRSLRIKNFRQSRTGWMIWCGPNSFCISEEAQECGQAWTRFHVLFHYLGNLKYGYLSWNWLTPGVRYSLLSPMGTIRTELGTLKTVALPQILCFWLQAQTSWMFLLTSNAMVIRMVNFNGKFVKQVLMVIYMVNSVVNSWVEAEVNALVIHR